MAIKLNRAALTHLWFADISRHHLVALVEELAHPWEVAAEDHRGRVLGRVKKRAAGAGARHRLVFVDRPAIYRAIAVLVSDRTANT